MKEGKKKTTIVIPADLHRRARIRAAETDTDFRSIVIRALEEYLMKPAKKGGKT
jgi:hypothetical protein